MGRNGLAHLYQQIPATLTDGRLWQLSFAGVRPGDLMTETESRRAEHLGVRVSPNEHVYLTLWPDVLLRDLEWAARGSHIFSQYLAPEYPQRPRSRRPRVRGPRSRAAPYAFSSSDLLTALATGRHDRFEY